MVLGEKVAVFDWEWAEIGQKMSCYGHSECNTVKK